MKLYSKIKVLPEMKDKNRVRLVDPITMKVDRSHTYWLHPTEATEVPDAVAQKLLKQDPALIDTKPHPECLNAAPKRPEIRGGLGIQKTQEDPPAKDYTELINDLANTDISVLEEQELRDWCAAFDLTLPASVKKPDTIRKKLLERVDAIVDEMETAEA